MQALFPILCERDNQLARTLSGGEQQMLALVRLLMLDEPFLGLAPQIVAQMRTAFEAIRRKGIAILFIEQNVRLAPSMAERGHVLESGRLAVHGPSEELADSKMLRRVFLGH